MKKYKLYLFDLDGTLLDSDQMLVETFQYLYKVYKPKDFVVDEKKIITFSGPPIRITLKQEFPELDQEELLKIWRKESIKNYPLFTKLFPGSLEMLSTLVEKNYKVAIVTNKHRAAADEAFKLFGIADLGIWSVSGDDIKEQKPAPEGIYLAMDHFGIKDKKDVVYIGDSVYDAKTAENAGVDFALVSWTPRKLPENAKISWKIDSYSSLVRSL